MKKIKYLALVLAVMFVCIMLPSCAEVVEVKDVTFAAITLDVDGNKTLLVDTVIGDISGTADDMPTVYDAVIQLLEENGIRHKTEDGAITSIANKSESTKNGYFYVWEYKINKKQPKGRANEILVEEGDHIVYYLTPDVDESAAPTDPDVNEDGGAEAEE